MTVVTETKAKLVLEDGTVFEGRSVGADGESGAEIVFNTSLTGYQEILTDPSYRGQLVVMTAPHIGNYGVRAKDGEAKAPQAVGLAMRTLCETPSNFASEESLGAYMKRHGVFAIDGIDTRALVRRLREKGCQPCFISTRDADVESLRRKLAEVPPMSGHDLVPEVSCRDPYRFRPDDKDDPTRLPIVVLDCGCKRSILEHLHRLGCAVEVVPAKTTAEAILARGPVGVLISNGPGDPAAVTYAVATVRGLLGKVPVFGLCLGHQLLGLALGGKTYKLRFGHRGGNQPVKDLRTGRVSVSAHNHGFAVDVGSLAPADVEPWFVSLNDGCNEGLWCRGVDARSVQFHPEAAPGPNDTTYLFGDWVDHLRNARRASA